MQNAFFFDIFCIFAPRKSFSCGDKDTFAQHFRDGRIPLLYKSLYILGRFMRFLASEERGFLGARGSRGSGLSMLGVRGSGGGLFFCAGWIAAQSADRSFRGGSGSSRIGSSRSDGGPQPGGGGGPQLLCVVAPSAGCDPKRKICQACPAKPINFEFTPEWAQRAAAPLRRCVLRRLQPETGYPSMCAQKTYLNFES